MALASTSWDDYPIGRSVLPSSAKSRQMLFNMLILGMLLVSGAAAALPILHMFEVLGSAVTDDSSPGATVAPSGPSRASRSLLERNSESFLKDSLALTRQCKAGCTRITSDVAEAEKIGRFAILTGVKTGMQQHFGLRAAPLVAETETSPLPMAVPAPAPVRVAPSIVVPLAPTVFAGAAPPVPAPRLDRSTESAAPIAAVDKPIEQALLPPPSRVASPTPAIGRSDGVAVYDISAATVYLPNGERLEAHSGLGYMVDNPRYADRKNTGPTPPNTYNLVSLPNLFYGVEALRLVPVDGYNKYGRDGFLTHTYLLRGRPAQSNGCVAFKDYARFLDAYKRGHVKRLVVVPSLSGSPMRVASASNG